MAEFGEMRRIPLHLAEVPKRMQEAVLSAEDDRFYQHPGVDWQGIARAGWELLRTGEKKQGGSTITMQVARNFFLNSEKTYLRKLNEIILAFRIEHGLTKDEILELYLNKIYLGHRAYGIGAAAQVYYGRPIAELTLPQMAMIAGLPKAPSRFNPVTDPERALSRRNYVLRRMRELGYVTQQEYQQALATPVTASLHGLAVKVEAPYVAEMVRAFMVDRYGSEAYTNGYSVYATVDSRLQAAASEALRKDLMDYDRRHGYRGAERHFDLKNDDVPARWEEFLADINPVAGLPPALVTAVGEDSVTAYALGVGKIDIPWKGLSWARPYISENRRGPAPKSAADIVAPGDVIRVVRDPEDGWHLGQVPDVEGALVALAPGDGAIEALVGGFDFYRSKFNRVTQAERQPGSSFKPFIYSAALASGFTPATIVNDAPVVFDDPGLESAWRPENYSGKFFGPTRLRVALIHSRNLVSIRVLRAVGVRKAIEYIKRFGIDTTHLPRDLSLALGSGTVAPLSMARGYAVFANGGYLVDPYFVDRIVGSDGNVVYQADPVQVCPACGESPGPAQAMPVSAPADGTTAQATSDQSLPPMRPAPRVITAQNAWLMTSMLRDVIRHGTGRRAMVLGRNDLAGKTGTTNDQRDAWFSGFNQRIVTTAWVGFDQLRPLGTVETGAHAALPMWIDFMRQALDGVPEAPLEQPKGLVTVRIDPETGHLASADFPNAIFETFRVEDVPRQAAEVKAHADAGSPTTVERVTEHLF